MRTWKALPGLTTALGAGLLLGQVAIAQEQSVPAAEPAQAEAPAVAEGAAPVSDRFTRMEHKFEKALQYYLEFNPDKTAEDFEKLRPWLKPFTDVEIMMDMFSDPRKMVQWMNAISEPEAVYLMMKCSTEPVMWDTWMRGMTDYDKMMRTMVRFMDPGMYMRWMMAPMNPQVWAPMAQFMDPNYYMKWMTALGNPTFYQPFFAWTNPNWYTPRLSWMVDPQSYAPIFSSMDTVSSTDKPTTE